MRITFANSYMNNNARRPGWPSYTVRRSFMAGILSVGLGAQTLALSAQTAPANNPPRPGAAKQPAPGKQNNKNELRIGPTLTITGYSKMDSTNFQDFKLTGPNIRIVSREEQSDRHIEVIADNAIAHLRPVGKETATLTDNVRYKITEKITVKTERGERTYERITEGTAREANYQEATGSLHLTGSVDAKVTDPEQFDGPARLHTGSLLILVPKDQTNRQGKKTTEPTGRYEVEGDASTNSITFTPHAQPPKPAPPAKAATGGTASKPKPKTAMNSSDPGTIHIHHFDAGTLLVGEKADFRGKQVVIETANAKEKTQNSLKAPHIVANLAPGARDIDASGGTQFESRSTLQYEKRAVTQILAGTAEHALWKQDAPLKVDGHIDATLTNPATLLEPATLVAEHLVADLGDKPRYVVTGPTDITRLTFAPRPSEAKPADGKNKSKVPVSKPVTKEATTKEATTKEATNPVSQGAMEVVPFVVGKVVVTRFQTATYEPDKSLVVSGPQIRFVSDDPKTKNYAEILTPHFEADLDQTANTLTEARATKGVSYRFRQLLPPQKEIEKQPNGEAQPLGAPGKATAKKIEEFQIVTGKGRDMNFKNDPDSQIITVNGVIENDIINPQKFADTAHLTGIATDSTADMTYELTTQHFHVKDDDRQTSMSFTPLPPPAKATEDSQSKKPSGRDKKKKK